MTACLAEVMCAVHTHLVKSTHLTSPSGLHRHFGKQDGEGKSALHWTAANTDSNCAVLLLAADPTAVNGLDHTQRTTLHLAIAEQNISVVQALLAIPGCNCSLPDEIGHPFCLSLFF